MLCEGLQTQNSGLWKLWVCLFWENKVPCIKFMNRAVRAISPAGWIRQPSKCVCCGQGGGGWWTGHGMRQLGIKEKAGNEAGTSLTFMSPCLLTNKMVHLIIAVSEGSVYIKDKLWAKGLGPRRARMLGWEWARLEKKCWSKDLYVKPGRNRIHLKKCVPWPHETCNLHYICFQFPSWAPFMDSFYKCIQQHRGFRPNLSHLTLSCSLDIFN